jgi:hypothetical protein
MKIYQLLSILMSDDIKHSDSVFIIVDKLKRSSPCLGGIFFNIDICNSSRDKLSFYNPYLSISVTPSLHDCVSITVDRKGNEEFLDIFKKWLEKDVV